MRLSTPFTPIEVGEIDGFAFDFSYDIGDAVILSGTFFCSLAPFQAINDPDPQSHVSNIQVLTMLAIRVPPNATLVQRSGNYVLAILGPFDSSLAGGTYVLGATANLSDGRVLSLTSTVLVKLPGD